LSWSHKDYKLASGGYDKNIIVWNLDDYINSAALSLEDFNLDNNSIGLRHKMISRMPPSCILTGSQDHVESVVFDPINNSHLTGVGLDKCIYFWDIRSSSKPCDNVF